MEAMINQEPLSPATSYQNDGPQMAMSYGASLFTELKKLLQTLNKLKTAKRNCNHTPTVLHWQAQKKIKHNSTFEIRNTRIQTSL